MQSFIDFLCVPLSSAFFLENALSYLKDEWSNLCDFLMKSAVKMIMKEWEDQTEYEVPGLLMRKYGEIGSFLHFQSRMNELFSYNGFLSTMLLILLVLIWNDVVFCLYFFL